VVSANEAHNLVPFCHGQKRSNESEVKTMKARLIFHGVAALTLIAAVAAAQTPKKPAKPASAAQASATADKSMGSAHASESVATPAPAATAKGDEMKTVSSNPLYKGNESAGANPLYQSKEKQAAPGSAGSTHVVEYKDGEDMTTRYRPGNNKTSKIKPTTGSETTPPSH
jgi:hypothetical protein